MTIRFAAAATLAILLPGAAHAATIGGQIDIAGIINFPTSTFDATGNADFEPGGIVSNATGDFASFATPFSTLVSFTDIDFTVPSAAVWSAAGFTFTATNFTNFVDTPSLKAFKAEGTITGNGFDATDSLFSFAAAPIGGLTQVSFTITSTSVPVPASLLLLGTALAGFGLLSRKSARARLD